MDIPQLGASFPSTTRVKVRLISDSRVFNATSRWKPGDRLCLEGTPHDLVRPKPAEQEPKLQGESAEKVP